ncbi:ATP-grasp domain-containing protein [Pseudonocardia sp. N23]|uniref:ATP-grasp domain-containing protein n=1 Tax=Pseudonocardia sp. N23 TaxID=1987376 RepID=UPI000BFCAA2A|nr:ATP-grasp domain-containing protein [Pseudonocardia sp. N23]GAY12234.1 ATP-grasp enzyme-like protein [Pseudonocardia sp. N23]
MTATLPVSNPTDTDATPRSARRVLVTGVEHAGGLAALRGLAAAGYEPWAATDDMSSYGALSRSSGGVVEVADPRLDAERFARDLVEAAARIGAVAVLPGTEAGLIALGRHRDLFPGDVAVGAPDVDDTVAALDKDALAGLAARAGFRTPPTLRLSAADVAAADITFPVVVKPVRSELVTDDGLARFEVTQAAHRAELASTLAALPGREGLVQPYLSGRIRTVNGVAWKGETLTTVHKLAERTWPADCGVVTWAETVERDEQLEAAARALIAELGWSGLFNLQLIESGPHHYLIDVNPRMYHSLGLAVAAGVNLPAMWTDLLLGERPEVAEYSRGVRFRSEEDVRSLWAMFRAGKRGAAIRGLLPHARTTHAVASVADPRPLAAVVRRAIRVATRRR